MTRIAIIASIAVCALIVPGCGQSDVIERYTVPKQPIIATAVGDSNRNVGDSQDVDMSRDRMLGAIVPRGKNSWFFKVTGPNGIVEDQMEEFLELIRSLRFSPPDNTPSWKLPVGWHREPDSQGMRFATIKIDTDADSLELSVIPLPTGSGDLDDYIVSNINRWREPIAITTDWHRPTPRVREADRGNDTNGPRGWNKRNAGQPGRVLGFKPNEQSAVSPRLPQKRLRRAECRRGVSRVN